MVNDDRIAGPKQIQAGIDFGWAIYWDNTPLGIDFQIIFIHLQNLLWLFTYSQHGPESSGLLFDLNQSRRQKPSLPDKVRAPWAQDYLRAR